MKNKKKYNKMIPIELHFKNDKMKHIDEYYKDWSGESHTTNSCHPVHDSAEVTDFAEFYLNQIKEEIQKEAYNEAINDAAKNAEAGDFWSGWKSEVPTPFVVKGSILKLLK